MSIDHYIKDCEKHALDVSRETLEKLRVYEQLLIKWQAAINLISHSTVANIWERHILDSLQLLPFLPPPDDSDIVLADIGSGAGFPGLVIAIARPDIEVHLIESDQKKCSFLNTVSRETSLTNLSVHKARIVEMFGDNKEIAPTIVTARALASVKALCDYTAPLLEVNKDLELLLPKGMKCDEELREASSAYNIISHQHKSITDDSGVILHVKSFSKT